MLHVINTTQSPKPIGPYSQAIQKNNFIFVSGQIATNIINNDISNQTHQILKNINTILLSQKLNVSNIVKTTIFMTDLADLKIINNIYQEFFLKYTKQFPARSCIEVSQLPLNAKIEIEAIAYTINN